MPKKKPTGESGSATVRFAQRRVDFERVKFPSLKADIERFVLDAALAEGGRGPNLREHYQLVGSPLQNGENDFDFTLPQPSGASTYVDLMEIALLHEILGSYDNAPQQYEVGQRAHAIWEAIAKKSEAYGAGPTSGVHLLLYTTDYRYYLGPSLIPPLVERLHRESHCFRSVVYSSTRIDSKADVCLLFPLSDDQCRILESEASSPSNLVIVFHPAGIEFADD